MSESPPDGRLHAGTLRVIYEYSAFCGGRDAEQDGLQTQARGSKHLPATGDRYSGKHVSADRACLFATLDNQQMNVTQRYSSTDSVWIQAPDVTK